MPSQRPPSLTAGFTLVETLVALALLAVALTALGRLLITSRLALEASLERSGIQRQAEGLVAALQALPPGHDWLADGVVLERPDAAGLRLQGTVQPWPDRARLQVVEVQAIWRRGPAGEGRFRLRALRRAGGRP